MSNSREVSQFSNFIVVDDSNRNIGIATTATPYVGIGTTNPQYKLDVVGDLNFTGTLRQNGSEYSSGIQNVVEDITPQLGGNLDLNGKTIDGTGGINITGVVTATSFTGNVTGTATTATTVVVTTSATSSNFKIPFANTTANTTGNYGLLQDSGTTFTYNPSSNTLDVGVISVGTLNVSTGIDLNDSDYIYFGSSDDVKVFYDGTANDLEIELESTANKIAITNNGTYTHLITRDGKVGINTSVTPTVELEVNGNANITGVITATAYYGDGSNLTGVSAAGYQFNVGITSIISTQLTAIGSNVLTLPSTSGKRYVIHSINASNVAVGNTEVNVIGAFDISGGERSYFAYNVPIPTGTSVELLKQPQVLNPSDIIVMRGTDYNRDGSDDAVQVYISYEVKDDTNYFGVGVGTVGIALTDPTTIYTSTTYPSVIQSIRLANRTDTGGYPVSVTITSGVTTTYLIDDLIVPKYGSVEILDTPKAMSINDTIQVIVDQTETIDVQVSGIKVT